MKPDWRIREEAAEAVNHLPAVDGMCKWKCEKCGAEWSWPAEVDYDRSQDGSNWPVLCDDCVEKSMESDGR